MKDSKSAHRFIASHLRDVPRSGIRDFFDIVSTRKDVISLGIGEPDFVTPWHIREHSIFALDHGATSYTANLGLLELRKAISKHLAKHIKVNYSPENEILVTVGVSEALDLAVRAVVNPGDEVLYHEPCYVSYAPIITFTHGVPVPVKTTAANGFRLNSRMLEEKVTSRTRALILNFPTNPTGAMLTPDDVRGIAKFAVKHDLIVITDEIYDTLAYDRKQFSIASLPGMKDRTIYLNGFSKAYAMTGFRIGYSCAPAPITDAMMKIHQYTMLCAPILSQKAAIEALNKGEPEMLEMREEYRKRRNFIYAELNEAGLKCHKPDGAFYAFPKIPNCGMTSKEFALALLDKENVACVPGTAFGSCGEGFIRCSYATAMSDIQEAAIRIKRFVSKLKK